MFTKSLARRYAVALFDLARERNILKTVNMELESVVMRLQEEPEMKKLLESPRLISTIKKDILRSLFPALDEVTINFLSLLVDKRRSRILDHVVKEYRNLLQEFYNVMTVEVKTAVPLSPALEKELQERLSQVTRKKIELSAHQDPEMIGGMIVKVGDTVIDGSVRTRLEILREKLVAGGKV